MRGRQAVQVSWPLTTPLITDSDPAAFAALVFHTFLYASFLEDPFVWVLLGLGTAARASARPLESEEEVGQSVTEA